MITQYRVTLLQTVTLIGTLIGSACYAAQQQKIVRTVTPKKDNSNVRYNEIAQKYSAIEIPTNQTVQEFKELLEKDKVFFDRKKQCKKELDLLLADITAQSTATTMNVKKRLAKLSVARKKGFRIDPLTEEALEPFRKTEEPVNITNEEQEEPTEEIETPPTTPREETSTIPEGPTVIPSEPPVTKPDTLSWLDDEAADDSQNVPTYQPEPLEMGNPARELAPFLQKPNELVKESTSIPLNQGGELSFPIGRALDIITEQLLEQVTTPEQEVMVNAFAENTERILSQITLIEQEAVLKSTAFVMKAISQQGPSARPSVVQELVQPLVEIVSQALVPTTLIQTMQKNQISIPQKQQFDLNTLPKILFAAGKSATLDAKFYIPFIQNINALFNDCSRKSALIAPTVTATLVLTSDDTTEEALGAQFYTLLESFDALLDGVDIQVQALQNSLKTYTGKNQLSKKFTENWDYFIGGTNTPSTLVPKLIVLYGYLSTVGPTIIDFIESYIKQYGPVMNSDIVEAFKNGYLLMESQYLPKEEPQKHKRLYLEDLKSKLSELEQLIQQGNAAIIDQQTKKDLEKQFTTLKKKFDKESRKKEPVKIRTPAGKKTSRFNLLGLGNISNRPKFNKPDAVTPESPKESPLKAIEEEKPQKPLPNLLPPPTALPVINQAFETLKVKIKNLNSQTATLDDTANLEKELNNFKTSVGASEYEVTKNLLSQKKQAITTRIRNKKRAKQLSYAIDEITEAKNSQAMVPSQKLQLSKEIAQRPTTTDDIKQLQNKLTTALENYCSFLIGVVKTKSKPLHTTTDNLLKNDIVNLNEIKNIIDNIKILNSSVLPKEKNNVESTVIGLCATYDAIMHTLYTPAIFNPLIARLLETNTTLLQRYLELITTAIKSIETIKQCIEKLEQFLPEETQTTFTASTLDISTIDTSLIENDAYRYAVPVGTLITIDDTLSIATLQELNAQHRKEYLEMVTAWQARIENNGTIEELKLIDFSKLNPQELETLTEQLETLSATMPTLFETDAVLKELAQKVLIKTENSTIEKLIAQLLIQIQEAKSDFEINKRIAQIEFATGYNQIQESVAKLDQEINPFTSDIENLTKQFAGYLTTIAEANVQNIRNFPDRPHNDRFAQDINTITIDTSFTNMITQLKTLGFLADIDTTENSFKELYTVILQGYGYILATFDALTAKLHDGAQDQQSWSTFFSTITGSAQSTQYASAQFIIDKLLKPIENRRSWYYQTLIEPYFTESTEIKNYLQGTLDLLTLGLDDIKTKNGLYKYMRTQTIIDPYGKKNTSITINAITGQHIRNYGYQSTSIVHGGDAQYTKIIDDWHTLIKDILKTQFQNQQVKEVQDMLDTILTIPFGEVTNKDDIYYKPTLNRKYKTTFNDMYTIKNRYRGTNTVNQFLYDILNAKDDNKEEELHRYLNDFFIDLSLALSNPTLITKLTALKKDNLLTPEIQQTLFLICGDSFALLDSVISWAYTLINYYTNTNPDKDNVSKIGTLLAQYEPYITHSITNVLKLTPYLSTDKLKEYNNQGLVISGLVQNPTQQGTMPRLYEFFIGTAPTTLQSIGAAFNITNPTKTEPQKLLGLTFLQEGSHTAQTIKNSLELLKAIPKEIGVSSASSIELEILLKLNPLHEMLKMSYTPSSEQLTKLITMMEPVFVTIQQDLKNSPQNNKQSYTLNSIARILISNYANKFEKQAATPAQKEAYTKLTGLFLNNFTSNINPNLQKYLTAITTTGTSLAPIKKPRPQNQQPAVQPTKPSTGVQQKPTPLPTPLSTETAIQLYKPENSGL